MTAPVWWLLGLAVAGLIATALAAGDDHLIRRAVRRARDWGWTR